MVGESVANCSRMRLPLWHGALCPSRSVPRVSDCLLAHDIDAHAFSLSNPFARLGDGTCDHRNHRDRDRHCHDPYPFDHSRHISHAHTHGCAFRRSGDGVCDRKTYRSLQCHLSGSTEVNRNSSHASRRGRAWRSGMSVVYCQWHCNWANCSIDTAVTNTPVPTQPWRSQAPHLSGQIATATCLPQYIRCYSAATSSSTSTPSLSTSVTTASAEHPSSLGFSAVGSTDAGTTRGAPVFVSLAVVSSPAAPAAPVHPADVTRSVPVAAPSDSGSDQQNHRQQQQQQGQREERREGKNDGSGGHSFDREAFLRGKKWPVSALLFAGKTLLVVIALVLALRWSCHVGASVSRCSSEALTTCTP